MLDDQNESFMNYNASRAPVPQTVVLRIQDMIASGAIKPGEKLPPQRELASLLAISRPSLREALRVLETLGVVRIEPGRGAVVCQAESPSHGWRFGNRIPKADVFQMRLLVEGYAAKLAAAKIAPDGIETLRALISEMGGHLRAGNLEGAAQADLAFHRGILVASGNAALAEMHRDLSNILLESHRAPLVDSRRLLEPIDEHEKILLALAERDGEGAMYFMRHHILRTAGRTGLREDVCKSW